MAELSLTEQQRADRIADRLLGIKDVSCAPTKVLAGQKRIIITGALDTIVQIPRDGTVIGARFGEPTGPRLLYDDEFGFFP